MADKTAAKKEPDIRWGGGSGKEYGFWIYNLLPSFSCDPKVEGNYILCKLVNGVWHAIYIGEGKLHDRINDPEHTAIATSRKGSLPMFIFTQWLPEQFVLQKKRIFWLEIRKHLLRLAAIRRGTASTNWRRLFDDGRDLPAPHKGSVKLQDAMRNHGVNFSLRDVFHQGKDSVFVDRMQLTKANNGEVRDGRLYLRR